MMQTAQAFARNHRRPRTGLLLDRSALRGVLLKRIVNSVVLKIGNVLPDQPTQVLFVEWDHVSEQLASATTHPAFGDTVLPGRRDARPLRLQTRVLEEVDEVGIELCVIVQDDVSVGTHFGKRLTQLLHDPICVRARGDVVVQKFAALMLDDEEAVKQLKGRRRHCEELERRDRFAVIRQEGQPTLD